MADFSVVFDPMLDKERAEFENGSGGSGGSSYVGGERINIAGGTISFVNSADIVNVTGTSVTLHPDTAYKIYATSHAITLNANPPAAGKWAYEGHLEIFVAGTGYVQTGTNVVLANALEPDSVNNCTLRFHDGVCIISVEDHVAGYIVVNGSTAGSGSLYYGITTSTNDYVAFDASLNGTTIPLAGAVAEGEKHIVGNGYSETTLTGAVNCGTSKFTVANLSLANVQVTGGTMTLGDVYIPNGATVSVSGGGLAVEKVSGNGVIDLGGSNCVINMSTAKVDGCVVTGGAASSDFIQGGAFYIASNGTVNLSGATVTGNFATNNGGGVALVTATSILNCTNSYIKGNSSLYGKGKDIWIFKDATANASNCQLGIVSVDSGGSLSLSGSNTIDLVTTYTSGSVTLTSGAVLDLTGNTNATPINPGGGVTFAPGGATVYPSAGQASAYMLGGMTVPTIGNTNVVNLGGSNVVISSGTTASASGCTFSGGSNTSPGGAFVVSTGAVATFDQVGFSGNNNLTGGGRVFNIKGAVVTITGCTFARTPDQNVFMDNVTGATLVCSDTQMPIATQLNGTNPKVVITGSCTQKFGAIAGSGGGTTGGGTVFIESGAVFDMTGNSRLPYPVIQTGGGIVVAGGDSTKSATIINSAGTSISIAGGTYSKLMEDGTIE